MNKETSELLIRGTNIPVDWEEMNGVRRSVSMLKWMDALMLAWTRGNRELYYPKDNNLLRNAMKRVGI